MPRLRSVKLNDGNEIPMMAFGTGTTHAFDDCSAVVSRALESGYTHLDCAWWYKNQSSVASGIRAVGRSRGDVCITSKAGDYHGEPELFDAEVFLEATLRDLCTDYVDTYLVGSVSLSSSKLDGLSTESDSYHADILVQQDVTKGWRQMEAIKKSGRARSIGVSNFSSQSLRTILASCEIPPAIHQVEFHPYSLFHYEASLLPLCREHHITIGAFAPLMSLSRRKGGPVDSAVEKVRQERGFAESESQILLLWAQQASGGIVVW
ncbi:NADP-dependent oxidoreductase domain-containing protein [Papiliotrema laurentii]|uniref:NADP-dependent oxidoreductase domain-containing protein n=1 Tax=Papiliotrema laurentii TaxID=5418 RepID=A0AAD9FNV3_PAPLA|nr:NADP-dependent oxidoreductase domain-containing protein [Papiliotrema laurentii]